MLDIMDTAAASHLLLVDTSDAASVGSSRSHNRSKVPALETVPEDAEMRGRRHPSRRKYRPKAVTPVNVAAARKNIDKKQNNKNLAAVAGKPSAMAKKPPVKHAVTNHATKPAVTRSAVIARPSMAKPAVAKSFNTAVKPASDQPASDQPASDKEPATSVTPTSGITNSNSNNTVKRPSAPPRKPKQNKPLSLPKQQPPPPSKSETATEPVTKTTSIASKGQSRESYNNNNSSSSKTTKVPAARIVSPPPKIRRTTTTEATTKATATSNSKITTINKNKNDKLPVATCVSPPSKQRISNTPSKKHIADAPPKQRIASTPPKQRTASTPPPRQRTARTPPPKQRTASTPPPKQRIASTPPKQRISSTPPKSRSRSTTPTRTTPENASNKQATRNPTIKSAASKEIVLTAARAATPTKGTPPRPPTPNKQQQEISSETKTRGTPPRPPTPNEQRTEARDNPLQPATPNKQQQTSPAAATRHTPPRPPTPNKTQQRQHDRSIVAQQHNNPQEGCTTNAQPGPTSSPDTNEANAPTHRLSTTNVKVLSSSKKETKPTATSTEGTTALASKPTISSSDTKSAQEFRARPLPKSTYHADIAVKNSPSPTMEQKHQRQQQQQQHKLQEKECIDDSDYEFKARAVPKSTYQFRPISPLERESMHRMKKLKEEQQQRLNVPNRKEEILQQDLAPGNNFKSRPLPPTTYRKSSLLTEREREAIHRVEQIGVERQNKILMQEEQARQLDVANKSTTYGKKLQSLQESLIQQKREDAIVAEQQHQRGRGLLMNRTSSSRSLGRSKTPTPQLLRSKTPTPQSRRSKTPTPQSRRATLKKTTSARSMGSSQRSPSPKQRTPSPQSFKARPAPLSTYEPQTIVLPRSSSPVSNKSTNTATTQPVPRYASPTFASERRIRPSEEPPCYV